MNSSHLVTVVPLVLSLTLGLASQAAIAPTSVPLHGSADGRTWAAGRDYKVAFDVSGMTFYPLLGETAPDNLPLAWYTRSVGYEAQAPLAGVPAATAAQRNATCFEIERGDVIERYLVRDDGVEQQFALTAPSSGGAMAGDFIVRGRIDGPLRATNRPSAHAPIIFLDAQGRAVVDYGTAFAVDALGMRYELGTAVIDGEVEIRVPAAWLATAHWPILIDPLTARSSAIAASAPASLPSVARDDVGNRMVISSARASAGNDWDLFVHVLNDSFGAPTLIYSDVTTDSVRASSVGWAEQDQRWLVAMEVHQPTAWRLRVYFHDTANLTFGSGLTVNVNHIVGAHYSTPSLGTSASSVYAALVARRDIDMSGPTNTDRSEVVLFLIHTSLRTIGAPTHLSFVPGQTYDAERPSITPHSDLGGWLVAWQEWDPLSSTVWDVIGRRIGNGGSLVGGRALLLGGDDHELTPYVAGGDSRFLLAAVRRPQGDGSKTTSILGDRVVTRRLQWDEAAPMPTMQSVVQVESSAPSSSIQLGVGRHPIAYDSRTASHWTLAWKRDDLGSLGIARVGFDGVFVEKTQLEPPPPLGSAFYSPTLCHDPDASGVIAVYTSQGHAFGEPLYARRLTHNLTAAATTYGTGCAGVPQTFNRLAAGRPWRGSEFFGIELIGGRPNAPTWLLAAAAPGSVPMPIGGPLCLVLLDSASVLPPVAFGAADAIGRWSVGLSIPSILPSQSAYWQFVQLDGGLLYGSAGLRIDFR